MLSTSVNRWRSALTLCVLATGCSKTASKGSEVDGGPMDATTGAGAAVNRIVVAFPPGTTAQIFNARLTTQDELPGLLQGNPTPPSGRSSLARLRDLDPVNFRLHAGTDGGGAYTALPFDQAYTSVLGEPVGAWDFSMLNVLVGESQANTTTSPVMDVRYFPDNLYTNTGPVGAPHDIPGYFQDPTFGAAAAYMANIVQYYNTNTRPATATPWPRPAGIGRVDWWEIYNEPDLSAENPRVAPELPAPSGVTLAPAAGGSMPAGTYCYRLSALDSVNDETTASDETCISTSGVGSVSISWQRSTAWGKNAAGYNIYGRTSADAQYMVFVGDESGRLAWIDSGSVTPSFTTVVGQLPDRNRTRGGAVMSPLEYKLMWDALVPAMKAVDPTIKVVGPAATNPVSIVGGSVVKTAITTGPTDSSFLDTRDFVEVLMTSAHRPDAISFHGYGGFDGNESEKQMLDRISTLMVPDIKKNILAHSQGLPIWQTEANANSNVDPRLLEARSFGVAWFGKLFAEVGSLDPTITNLYQYTFECPGCPGLGLVAEPGSPVAPEGTPYLPYWATLEMNRYFPAGSKLLSTSHAPEGADVLAAAIPPSFTTVHVMVVNAQPAATCCAGATVTTSLLLAGFASSATSVLVVDADTDLVKGPSAKTLGAVASVPLLMNGYGIALIEFVTAGRLKAGNGGVEP